jgi:serine/threonine-protein kinase
VQLSPGGRLGPYEILERIGAGGMGEVYRARDTRLQRTVAIKVLPPDLASDARLRSRFDREAKVISALNHPHICTLHDVGSENGVDYLVMEYCEGQTLADRIDRGALPIDQALQLGSEIADALSRAHRAGIVHRDLKPSNVMVTASGVKLLDFGLAKQRTPLVDNHATTSLQQPLSEAGTILGTLQYMAPEVIGGAEADARSDIFALGLVLYEMLTGRRAFIGESKAAVMAAILEREPPPLPAATPPALTHLIAKCLSKNPQERWESAHDVAEQLRWLRQNGSPAPLMRRQRGMWLTAAASALAVAAVAFGVVTMIRRREERPAIRLSIPVPPATASSSPPSTVDAYAGGLPSVAISADGKRIAFVALVDSVRRLYLRPIDSAEASAVGTGEVPGGFGPFFSPDGEWLGFSRLPGALLKTDAAGGTPQELAKLLGTGRGADWSPDGWIYFSPTPSGGIWRVRSDGGQLEKLTTPDTAAGENSHRWPALLPDGENLLMTIRTDKIASFDDAKIAVLSLRTRQWKVILDGGTCARYVPSGQIVFGHGGAIYAAPFALKTMSVTGARRKILDGVITNPISGAVPYAVSRKGDLVYVPSQRRRVTDILDVDRTGRVRRSISLPFHAEAIRLSPDSKRIVLQASAANDDIYIYEMRTEGITRLSYDPGDESTPIWTRDGAVVYTSLSQGTILTRRLEGSGTSEVIRKSLGACSDASPDGRSIACTIFDQPRGEAHVWLLDLSPAHNHRPLLKSASSESEAVFSPDGKWLAYELTESGTRQILITSTASTAKRWQVSLDGGESPRWARDGRSLFFWKGDDLFQAIVAFAEGVPRTEKPRLLFSRRQHGAYDVTDDGFLIGEDKVDVYPFINVVLNWKQLIN